MGDPGAVVKNAFSYTDAIINALETSLSPERMATYVGHAGGACRKVFDVNAELGAAGRG